MQQEEQHSGGQLGSQTGARYRTYERLKHHFDDLRRRSPLFASEDLQRTIDDLYRYPLRSTARDLLNRQLRAGISNEDLARLVVALRSEDRLSLIQEQATRQEPRILCSLGLFEGGSSSAH
jgi:hypothetical protein